MGLHFSNLRHHLLVKMTVEKTVKTGSDVKSKTSCRFLLILTRWTRIYAYLVILTKTDRWNNGQNSLKLKITVFSRYLPLEIYLSKKLKSFYKYSLLFGLRLYRFQFSIFLNALFPLNKLFSCSKKFLNNELSRPLGDPCFLPFLTSKLRASTLDLLLPRGKVCIL